MPERKEEKGLCIIVPAILFVLYGLPIWAMVNILQQSNNLALRATISFTSVSYVSSNIALICLVGSKREQEKKYITMAYLLLFLYYFPGSFASLVMQSIDQSSFAVNIISSLLILAHGVLNVCILKKQGERRDQMVQPRNLLRIFLIGTAIILLLPLLVLLLIGKIICQNQNHAPRIEREPAAHQVDNSQSPVVAAPAQIVQVIPQPIVPAAENSQSLIIQPVPNAQRKSIIMDDKPELKFFQQGNQLNSYLIERELTHQPTMLKNAEISCSICLEQFENEMNLTVLIKCKHVFHSACIRDWLNKNKDSCPLCRSSVYAPSGWLNKQQ